MKRLLILAFTTDTLTGDVTGLRGDVDACDITPEERAAGVDVTSLVKATP